MFLFAPIAQRPLRLLISYEARTHSHIRTRTRTDTDTTLYYGWVSVGQQICVFSSFFFEWLNGVQADLTDELTDWLLGISVSFCIVICFTYKLMHFVFNILLYFGFRSVSC